jgi:hypothetical protein
VHDFIDGEAGARHVAADAVDAIEAVVLAVVGEEDLQQRDAAAIGRIAVADAHALVRAQAATLPVESRRTPPDDAHEASYLAASARMASLRWRSTRGWG